jgi:hypothetical protein
MSSFKTAEMYLQKINLVSDDGLVLGAVIDVEVIDPP